MQTRFSRAIAIALGLLAAVLTGFWGLRGHAIALPSALSTASETQLATAAAPPALVTEILNGKPISVLYMTRSEDTVLVRCYPGFEPIIRRRAMGSNLNAADAQQEGVLRCENPADYPREADLPDLDSL
ncbi:MAG: hypothetical protein F6K00_16320 [Leptolyngbya sp. SIOISBB]|nr:hypothetical protein [Leptolyngbya sp. SIOISBB]